MHRETAHTRRRSRSLAVLLLALAIVAVFGIAAQQALASPAYNHGGTACASCHTGSPSGSNVASARCITCHTAYKTLAGKTCWTCHTPGQAMAAVKAAAPANCTTVCHLASGTDSTHAAHVPDRGVCTTCHPLTASATNANGSWHHTARVLPATTVTLKVSPASIKLKKTVKATGVVTPVATLTGTKVALKAVMKKGAKWVTAKTAKATVSATGTYTWTYKPAKKGTYRMTATIAKTTTYAGSKSATKTFKVK